ncbi:hypothetical protein Taro_056795 [Colocasia esculenta]|uniref:Uncharacterized protein n=1 Tax=Colocasia esculenta TaxID=4460 RepID=A0A843XUD6_COLES|nr:hypothetical protein [Colocasia esculenta]
MAASGSFGIVGGYIVAFLTADQQERYSEVKIKLCGNKAVDLVDMEKHGMLSMVEALQRLKWTGIFTVLEPSYPHLAKAFYTCLKTEEDGSLTSTVKGTYIHITHDLLERLFGVSTVGHSLVESVDIHAKGLGIIGTEYKLKDGKIDINQDEFRTCGGRVEELLVAGELWINHKKLIFFPRPSATTCTNRPLEVDQRRRPCEHDGPIGRVLSLFATVHLSLSQRDERTVAISLPDLTSSSRSSHPIVAFWSRHVATLIGDLRDLTSGSDGHVAFFISTRRDLPA